MHQPPAFKDRYWLHILLFLLTLVSTVYSGALMAGRMLVYADSPVWFTLGGLPVSTAFLMDGLLFGGSLLLFLTVHEFGHYFAARHHRVATSLPYYIPFPFNGIGTFGAVIRIRQQVPSMRKLFDIGAAGPLAGFVVAFLVLIIALVTLPSPEYLNGIPGHEAVKEHIAQEGTFPAEPPPSDDPLSVTLTVGTTPLYWLLTQLFDDVPPMWEMYHYPMLFAGWLGLFFTALNLLPVGQLDGGHILYALVGPLWHRRLARAFVLILLLSGGIGFMDEIRPVLQEWGGGSDAWAWLVMSVIMFLYLLRIFQRSMKLVIPWFFGVIVVTALAGRSDAVVATFGYSGWFIWLLLILLLIRVDHPPVAHMEPLTPRRKALAILSMLIFALCFSIKPLYLA